ncbi:MAG TPA: RICIN domain-containing protein [Cytophagales bacterium]
MEKIYIAHTPTQPAAPQTRPHGTSRFPVFPRRLLLSLLTLLTAAAAFGQTTWMGMRFTVGGTPLNINALGRMVAPGNSRTHQLKLVNALTGKDVPGSTVSVSLAGAASGQFKYASLPRTVTLPANGAYYLVSSETQGGDTWYSSTTSVTTTSVATCFGGVFWDGSSWTAQGGTNNTFVPVSFTYGPRDPENPSGTSGGLNYAYYQGANWWDFRPNVDNLRAVKTGTKSYFDISGNLQSDNFAFKYTGYVDVPTTGWYTFYTYADDACDLYVGGALVVSNNQKNVVTEKSGRIELKAGKHSFSVVYMDTKGSHIFYWVKYEGPGVAKQMVPQSRISRGGTVSETVQDPVTVGPTFSGYYNLLAKHSGKAIDISGASTTNGADAVQYTKGTSSNQQFSIQSVGSGYYKLVAKHSGKVLAVTNSTSNVEQYTYSGTNMQQWKVELQSDGYYKITNRGTGKSLDVASASTQNGVRILQFTYTGASNQKWKLQSVTSSAREAAAETAEEQLEEATADLTLFPNPAQDVVQVTYKAKADGPGSVEVSDATSQRKLSRTVELHAGDNVVDLDVTSLPTGIYFLRFSAEGKEVTKKLVVAK